MALGVHHQHFILLFFPHYLVHFPHVIITTSATHEQLLKARFPFHLPWDRVEEEEEGEESSSGSNVEGSYECLDVTRRANGVNEVLFLGV